MAGLYLSEDEEGNAEELAAVGPLVEEYGDIIDAVIVGNEVNALCKADVYPCLFAGSVQ